MANLFPPKNVLIYLSVAPWKHWINISLVTHVHTHSCIHPPTPPFTRTPRDPILAHHGSLLPPLEFQTKRKPKSNQNYDRPHNPPHSEPLLYVEWAFLLFAQDPIHQLQCLLLGLVQRGRRVVVDRVAFSEVRKRAGFPKPTTNCVQISSQLCGRQKDFSAKLLSYRFRSILTTQLQPKSIAQKNPLSHAVCI